MFLLINPKNFKRRCKRILYPEKITVGEKYYFSLTLPIIRGIPQWQGLCTKEKLLLPAGLVPPPCFSVYGDYDWQLNLAVEKLKKRLVTDKCDLVFVDIKGRFGRLVSRIAEYTRNVAVISENTEYYEQLREEMYSGLGCYLEINSTLGLQNGYLFVAEGEPPTDIGPQFRRVSVNSVTEEDVAIPDCFLRYFPKDIPRCALSEALYSKWGVGRIGDYVKNIL